jgi:hypothetical protein
MEHLLQESCSAAAARWGNNALKYLMLQRMYKKALQLNCPSIKARGSSPTAWQCQSQNTLGLNAQGMWTGAGAVGAKSRSSLSMSSARIPPFYIYLTHCACCSPGRHLPGGVGELF